MSSEYVKTIKIFSGIPGIQGPTGATGAQGPTGPQGPGGGGDPTTPTWEHLTLSPTDISNQYIDLAQTIENESMSVTFEGVTQYETTDYTLSSVGGKTRVSFVNGLATGGAKELVVSDILHFQYRY